MAIQAAVLSWWLTGHRPWFEFMTHMARHKMDPNAIRPMVAYHMAKRSAGFAGAFPMCFQYSSLRLALFSSAPQCFSVKNARLISVSKTSRASDCLSSLVGPLNGSFGAHNYWTAASACTDCRQFRVCRSETIRNWSGISVFFFARIFIDKLLCAIRLLKFIVIIKVLS